MADQTSDPFEARIPPASSALSHIKVLDLTRVRSGPTCVRQLADWGARVIAVEPPSSVGASAMGGPRTGPDFQNLHRNKQSITLNLKDPRGVQILKSLAKDADVVVENFRPDVKDRLGINYEALAEDNPRLVYASISGFGQDGPYRKRPGFDQIAQGMGGLMSITGTPGEGPMRVGIPIADLCAGMFAAQAIMIALMERTQSGKGQWVQTSLLQAQIFMLDFQAARFLMDGDVPGQAGNNHPTMIPTGVFPTANGYINIAVVGQAIWERFSKTLDRETWLTDPRFATEEARSANRDALSDEISSVTRSKTSQAWVDRLNTAGVPCGEINQINEVFEDVQVSHLGMAQPMTSQERGETQLVGQPMIMSRTPSQIASPPPTCGQHGASILKALGFSEDEVEALNRDGVV